MTVKLNNFSLAALVAGAALVGGFAAMNSAGTAQAEFKFKANCMPGMKLVGSPTSAHYSCVKGILTICKTNYKIGTPTLVQKSANVWKVEYTCDVPPS